FCDAIYDERKHFSKLEVCGLRLKQKERQRQKAERIKDEYYDVAPPYAIHESLEILGFGTDVEVERKNRQKLFFIVRRPYHCRCYLCGKELFFYYNAFEIRNDKYGGNAILGYYSDAHCDCHQISSFQWRTIDLLRKNGVKYRVEVSFDDLIGVQGHNPLRYDFGLYSECGDLIMLLECQGEQHYKPVAGFGGGKALVIQKQNDAIKREYAFNHGIPLVEIPYTCNTYEKEKSFLRDNGII
ncbi:MAG: hypothetical protein IKO92_00640, partial [Clostridia bacterium]|nr:hypothetical protein [Clostridia bacterium]